MNLMFLCCFCFLTESVCSVSFAVVYVGNDAFVKFLCTICESDYGCNKRPGCNIAMVREIP
jgi:hypothetical protein